MRGSGSCMGLDRVSAISPEGACGGPHPVTSTPYRVSTTTAPAAGLSGVCPRARAAVATTR